MGSENSGNRDIGVEAQNSKNRNEALCKLNEIKSRQGSMDIITIHITDVLGKVKVEEYYYSRNSIVVLTSNPCRCLIRKLYYETYGVIIQNWEVDILIINFKEKIKEDKDEDLNILLGLVFEVNFLETQI